MGFKEQPVVWLLTLLRDYRVISKFFSKEQNTAACSLGTQRTPW